MLHDLKHAYRMLMHSKGWTVVVLLSLAIGIGATTALFTAVNGLLLQTVPVRDPHSLVVLKWTGKNDMVRSSSDYGYSAPVGGGREGNVRGTFSNAISISSRPRIRFEPVLSGERPSMNSVDLQCTNSETSWRMMTGDRQT